MPSKPQGTPRPTERQVRLLDEAIATLEAAGGDARAPQLRRALGTLDELRDHIGTYDPYAFPEGFADALTSARLDLNLGDPAGALEALKTLRRDLGEHWSE